MVSHTHEGYRSLCEGLLKAQFINKVARNFSNVLVCALFTDFSDPTQCASSAAEESPDTHAEFLSLVGGRICARRMAD